eukprot:1049384-Pleurochrysis_carterae.AAC.1
METHVRRAHRFASNVRKHSRHARVEKKLGNHARRKASTEHGGRQQSCGEETHQTCVKIGVKHAWASASIVRGGWLLACASPSESGWQAVACASAA